MEKTTTIEVCGSVQSLKKIKSIIRNTDIPVHIREIKEIIDDELVALYPKCKTSPIASKKETKQFKEWLKGKVK